MEHLKIIFDKYAEIYRRILKDFYPAKGSTGFPERNLSVNWSKAVESVYDGDNVTSWFEFQFGEDNNKHIDALIWDKASKDLYFVESKRYSNPKSKIREVGEDIVRLFNLYKELRTEENERINIGLVEHCYGVILADVWTKKEGRTGRKIKILNSYKNGSFLEDFKEIISENESLEKNNIHGFPNLKYYYEEFDWVSKNENYALVSFAWTIS